MNKQAIEKYGIAEFDLAEHLKNDEMIALYLEEVLHEGSTAEFVRALNTVARAKGMNDVAQKAGIGRESLYRSLRAEKPRFDTITKVLDSLGIDITFTARNATA